MAFDSQGSGRQPMMRSFRALMTSLLALLLLYLGACTTVQVQSALKSPGNLRSGESIVLLSKIGNAQDLDDDDVDACIGSSMRLANPELGFVSARLFRENLYPYFMPGTTPHTVEDFKNILDKEEVRERIAALSVRFLVILTRGRTNTDWHGGILCGAGYGGGGCLGLSWWDRRSELDFAVWDLQNKSFSGNVQATAAGKGIMPAFGLPIPIYSPATESAVCKELGARLAELLGRQE